MPDVFISYKREERDAVTTIVDRLRALALDVWFDADLSQSASFDEEIAAKLDASRCVVVCWTPAALASEWVRGEAALAHGDGKLVACFLEPTKLMPPFNLQQTEDLMRWAGQDDDPAWLRLLTGIGERVSRPGIATFAAAMAPGAPLDRLRAWVDAHGADPLAERVWARIRLLEGETSAARLAREQLEARSRDQRRLANEARSKALAKARGLRDPAAQQRRLRLLAAVVGVTIVLGGGGLFYSIDMQGRTAALGEAQTPEQVRAFLARNAWHPIHADALRKYQALDSAAWADARATGTLAALQAYATNFAGPPEGQFQTAARVAEREAERVRRTQVALTRLQIYRGATDGALDAATRAAIETFRFRSGAPVSDVVNDDLLAALDRTIAAFPTIAPGMLVTRRPGPPSEDDYRVLAARTGLDAPTLYALRMVEGDPRGGFSPDGRARILFERHIFHRLTRGAFDAAHPRVSNAEFGYPHGQEEIWPQLEEAYALDPESAYKATSFGLFGLIALNHKSLGFDSPGEMVWFMSLSETHQLEVLIRLLEGNHLLPLLKAKDWAGFARRYTGSALSATHAEKLERAHADGLRNLGFFAQVPH